MGRTLGPSAAGGTGTISLNAAGDFLVSGTTSAVGAGGTDFLAARLPATLNNDMIAGGFTYDETTLVDASVSLTSSPVTWSTLVNPFTSATASIAVGTGAAFHGSTFVLMD